MFLWLGFPWWLVIFSIFSYTCWSLVYLLLRNIYSSHLPILKLGYLFSCYWVICSPYRFQTLILYQIMLWNYFLSFQRFPLYSEALWCDVIPFAWFFFFFSFVACAFSPIKVLYPKKSLSRPMSGSFSLSFLLVVLQLSSYT